MDSYQWLKAFHVIAVVAWFAALFYIFRLYVYHVENRDKPEVVAVLQVMERRLFRGICWPAMLMTALLGVSIWSLNFGFYLSQGWFHVKLTALVGLIAYHLYCGKVRKDLLAGRYRLTSRQCRLLNEVPLVFLVLIVVMAVVKPF